MIRALGIDFGQRRIGLAIGISEPRVISPRKPIAASGTLSKDAITIATLAQSEEINVVVMGIPNHEDSRRAVIHHRLADLIAECGVRVARVDESLTTVMATERLAELGLKSAGRKKVIDSQAASIILERFFDGDEIH